MVDPTSDVAENVTEETAPECAACGDPIVREPTHRVVTRVEDGEAHHRHFCDEECPAAFEGEGED